jgi:hypothetical protein
MVLIVLVTVLTSGHGLSSQRLALSVALCLSDSVMIKLLFSTLSQPVSEDLAIIKRVHRHGRAHRFPLLPECIVEPSSRVVQLGIHVHLLSV